MVARAFHIRSEGEHAPAIGSGACFHNINEMNAIPSPILKASVFDSAYLYNMKGVNFRSIYEWTKEEGGWRKVPRTGNPV
jgi:hypothetical protein